MTFSFNIKFIISSIVILMIFTLSSFFGRIPHLILYSIFIFGIGYGFILLLTKKDSFFQKSFFVFYFMIVINFISLLLVPSFESLQYAIVKFGLFSLMIGATLNYRDYFIKEFPSLFKKFMLLSLFISILFYPNIFGDGTGYKGIFGTRNELGLIASLTFAIVLLEKKFTKLNILILIFCLLLVLLSTSRASIIGIIISFIFAGFSWKKVFGVSLLASIILYLSTFWGIKSGLDRLNSEDITSGRYWEVQYGIETIMKEPLTGWGLDKYAFIDKDVVSIYHLAQSFVLNPHNSYIGGFTQYGLIFGTLIFILIFYYVIKVLFSKYVDNFIKMIISFTLINGIVETYLFSISGLPGFLFWFYLVIGVYKHNELKNLSRFKNE